MKLAPTCSTPLSRNVDRYSGYAWLKQLAATLAAKIFEELTTIFNSFGWPNDICTGNGPQFQQECKEFCRADVLTHELESAHNPESNSLA